MSKYDNSSPVLHVFDRVSSCLDMFELVYSCLILLDPAAMLPVDVVLTAVDLWTFRSEQGSAGFMWFADWATSSLRVSGKV